MKHWWLMRVKRFCFFFQTNWKRRTCSLACPSGAAIFAVCFSFFKANYVDQLFLEFIYQVLDRRRRRQLRPLTGSLDREIWNNLKQWQFCVVCYFSCEFYLCSRQVAAPSGRPSRMFFFLFWLIWFVWECQFCFVLSGYYVPFEYFPLWAWTFPPFCDMLKFCSISPPPPQLHEESEI